MTSVELAERTTNEPPSKPAPPHGHLPALDGLRGAAVLMVMLCHFTASGLPHTVTGMVVRRGFQAGWAGVDLFFVLSGFLITGILYDAKLTPHYFRNFYVRRTLRIFPLYYGFLIAFFWVLPYLHAFTPAMQRVAVRQGWLWGYGANLVMARERHWIFDVDWLKLGHFWTLAIEEQFYLLWPLVVFRLSRTALVRACIAMMLTALVLRVGLLVHGSKPITVGMFTLCRFDALAMGALVALLLRGDAAKLYQRARVGMPVLLSAMVGITIWRRRWDAADPAVQSVGFTLLGLFFATVLLIAIEPRRDGRLARLLGHPFLRWFGAYSYAMYVFHVALMPAFERLAPVARLSTVLHSSYAGVAAYVLFAISSTSLVAYLSWHCYEKHFLALRKRFTIATEPASAPVAATDAGVLAARAAYQR